MLCTFTFSFDHFPLTNSDPLKRATATTAAITPENSGYACHGVMRVNAGYVRQGVVRVVCPCT